MIKKNYNTYYTAILEIYWNQNKYYALLVELKIRWLYLLQKGMTRYGIKLHWMVRFYFWEFGEHGVPIQVHFDQER